MLKIPWCMIWGGADRTAPLDPLGNRMHELFPDIPFHVVQGSGPVNIKGAIINLG